MTPDERRWNHNIHYFPVLLSRVPTGARRALDVGCGEGVLSRRLHEVVPSVVGIDLDHASIEVARSAPRDGVEYVVGDFLAEPFDPESFDVIVAVAVLHHLEAEPAVARMRELLRRGGLLGLIGLPRRDWPRDLPSDVVSAVATRVLKHTGGRTYWETPAPKIWPPPRTFRQERTLLQRELPGVDVRRQLLWRYTATWIKPV